MRVTLSGEVIYAEDQWLYDFFGIPAFSPETIRQALRDNPQGESLVLEINSPGGSVFAGFEMYSVLRAASCPVEAEVQSLAASAATTMMVGCSTVRLSPVAQVMIHLPLTYTEGNQADHRESIRVLDSITESILNAYELRCGNRATRAQLREMMEQSTWMPAQDAVSLGLADGLLLREGEDPVQLTHSVVNSAGTGVGTDWLRARYEAMVRSGAAAAVDGHPVDAAPIPTQDPPAAPQADPAPQPPAAPEPVSDDWQAKARLDIEKNRFV